MATIALVLFAAVLALALFVIVALRPIEKAPLPLYIERTPRRPRRRTP